MRPHVTPRSLRIVSAAVVMVLALVLVVPVPGARAHLGDEEPEPTEGWIGYDGGGLLDLKDFPGPSIPLELAIDFFAVGQPAVKWRTDLVPTVTYCTHQSNRPAWLSAERFRESVNKGMQVWNDASAAVGLVYSGDCTSSATWSLDNGVNEIGWDDGRDFVRGSMAAVASGTWSLRPLSRDFVETDIVIDHQADWPLQCLDSVLAHEVGHTLGFGHSTTLGDLMYREFNTSDLSTCPGAPSAREVTFLRQLYGVNAAPSIAAMETVNVAKGAPVTVSVSASDADGDVLTFTWTQTSGPVVGISTSGPRITFTAPSSAGVTLTFHVTARDRFQHATSSTVTVRTLAIDTAPTGRPTLDDIRVSQDGTRMRTVWTSVADATEYRLCLTSSATGGETCQTSATPEVEVTWDTVLGAPSSGEPIRVFTSDTRRVTMRACNPSGCGQPGTLEPVAGGLRWAAHQVDYDYFAVSLDVPIAGVRFTIAVVQNLTGAPRRFQLYSGSVVDPRDTLIQNCGQVAAGGLCIGLLTPEQRGHQSHVAITSTRSGTPELEHRIRIR